MATIARIIVTEAALRDKRQLFIDFITESKKILTNGEKHQFILLPAGFLIFPSNDLNHIPLSEPQDIAGKLEWNAAIEDLKEQALTEFHRFCDTEMLDKLKSVANYLVIGINSEGNRIQFVLVYDLQSNKPLHWTGKTYPRAGEKDILIKMPIETHFIKEMIDGKKVAVFGCHDLSIFNPRHQHHFSPFDDDRKNVKRKDNTYAGKIKCSFIQTKLKPALVPHFH